MQVFFIQWQADPLDSPFKWNSQLKGGDGRAGFLLSGGGFNLCQDLLQKELSLENNSLENNL